MKAFVTGGTGFIGEQVVRQLVARGYDVTCLTRQPEKAVDLAGLGVTLLQGDINDRDSMRPGMLGADVLFHVAGWYELGLTPKAAERMERINVHGTESVLSLATELDVPKIVYTSTVVVLGDTYGAVVDETHRREAPFTSAYDRTKYQAHQIAKRYVDQGAPVVIVMPTAVYGPGDHSLVALLLRLLLQRMLPVLPGADTGFTLVHVEDVARGHVLAAEKGRVGESYILGGDPMTLGDTVQAAARLAGVPAPLLFVDAKVVAPLEPLARWLERWVSLPRLFSSETVNSLGETWLATSAKAEQELGYTHRPVEEGLIEAIMWELAQMREKPAFAPSSKRIPWLVLATGFLALAALLLRRRNSAR